ncbi:MAG: thiamine diphosphokinase, partial [Evtepia gabavorous]
ALGFLAQAGATGYLYGKSYLFTALRNGSLTLPARKEGIFSLFCLGQEAQGVSIHGAQYPLDRVPVSPFFPIGVSNHFQGNPVTIQVETGCLLIGWEIP